MQRLKQSFVAVLALCLVACGGKKIGVADNAAVTTATPPPGPFNGTITVSLRTDKPALLFATTDGSDPHKPSPSRLTGDSVIQIPLMDSATIKAFSRTQWGTEEQVKTFQYTRAGGPVGTATGEIVVGLVAASMEIGLELDGNIVQTFQPLNAPGKIPFTLTDLTTATHKVRAVADRTNDGNFTQFLDYWSATSSFDIDLTDPYKASASGIELLLGTSESGLCTIEGIITVPTASTGQSVSISALDSSALGGIIGGGMGGTGMAAQNILGQLQNGYQVFAMGNANTYPYAITGLQPGSYTGLPVLSAFSNGALGFNLFVDPFNPIHCTAGAVIRKDYTFGTINYSGHVHTPGAGFGYGMAAARSFAKDGIEVVLMPVLLFNGSSSISGSGLLDGQTFDLMAYTSLDSSMGTGGPLLAALQWAINPLGSATGQTSFHTSGADVSLDFTTH